jgi:hypothetical protein
MAADYDRMDPRDREAARERVNMPGTFLIVVAGLNVLLAGWSAVGSVQELFRDDKQRRADVHEQFSKFTKEQREGLDKLGVTEETVVTILRLNGTVGLAVNVVALAASGLAVLGGLRMIKLRSRGLALTGAILTAIPIVSPCCCFGQVVGLWTVIVLLNSDVKAAFQANEPPREGYSTGSSPFPP